MWSKMMTVLVWLWLGMMMMMMKTIEAGSELQEPDILMLSSQTTYLNVSKCSWDIGGKITVQTRCYCYMYSGARKCTIPGPTLSYTAGEDAFIRISNNLKGLGVMDMDGHLVVEDLMSHDPDVTNLHTHGLHVDPVVDDVVDIAIEPGKHQDYNFTILPDHYPGLHWYHDHWHGTVTFHVHTGLFGAIVMTSPEIEKEYDLNMTSRLLVLHGLSLNNASLDPETGECNCTGYTDWFDGGGESVDSNPLKVKGFHLTTICDQWCDMYCYQRNMSGTPPKQIYNDANWLAEVAPQSHVNWDGGVTLFMVNGQVQPKITIGVNEWVRLRIANADAQGAFMLHFNDSSACQYYYIASDGVFFDAARNLTVPPFSHHVFITMAGRIEVVLMCQQQGVYEVKHTSESWNVTLDGDIGCNPVYQTTTSMFTINVSPSAPFVSTSFDPDMMFPPKVGYIEDTVGLTSDQYLTNPQCTYYNTTAFPGGVFWTMHPDIFSSQIDTDCTKVTIPTQFGNQSFTGALFGINGQYFRHDSPLAKMLPDNVYEMKVKFFPHPYHHHINPFQLQQNIAYGFIGQIGDWRDVVSSGCSPGNFTARVRTLDYTGKVVMHCHFLPHEDRGLMGYYIITSDSCTSSNGLGLPAESADCAQESSPDFCLGSIVKGVATLKIWGAVLVVLVMGIATLL